MNGLYAEIFNTYILPALAAALVGAGVSLWNMLNKWVRAHVSEKNQLLLSAIVSEGVRAAEQLWANPGVQEILVSKKEEAFAYIDARLKDAKIPTTAEQIYMLIEAEVLKLKNSGEEVASAKSTVCTDCPHDTVNRVLPDTVVSVKRRNKQPAANQV